MEFKIAIATDDKKVFTSEHFGDAEVFLIYENKDGKLYFLEERKNVEFEEETHGDEKKANHISLQLKDVDVLLGKVFGPNIVRMKNKYVCVVSRIDEIEKALGALDFNLIEENLNKKEKDILYVK